MKNNKRNINQFNQKVILNKNYLLVQQINKRKQKIV